MKIRITPGYLLAFSFLTLLCGLTHEFVHHVSGALICGCWGYKTFNSFILCDTCDNNPLRLAATLIGPLATFALMWMGWYQLKKADVKTKQLGFALIFANFPINRILFAFLGYNDEQFFTKTVFGESVLAHWVTILIILGFTLPPLIEAYCQMRNRFKIFWFIGYLTIPFVFVILFAGFFLEEYLLLKLGFLKDTIWGMPYLLILVEIVCLAGYYVTKKYIYQHASLTK